MADAFVKVYRSILRSSLWVCGSKDLRLLFVAMLAEADADGVIRSSLPGLADIAKLTIEETRGALEELMRPDPYDSSGVAEGVRVTAIDGGWRVVNHARYRDRRTQTERQRRDAERKRAEREAAKAKTPPAPTPPQPPEPTWTRPRTSADVLTDREGDPDRDPDPDEESRAPTRIAGTMPDPERLLEALGRWPALRAIATNEIAQAQATNGALAGLRHADLVAGLEDLGPKAAARQAAGNAWSAGELAEKIFTFGRSAKLKRERSPATPDAAVDDEPPRQRTHDPEYAERIRKHQLALVARHEQAKVPDPAKVAEFERLQRLAEEL